MKRERATTILVIASCVTMTGFAVLIGSGPGGVVATLLEREMSTESSVYFQRFIGSFLLLGVVPFFVAVASGVNPRDLGLRRPQKFGSPPWLAGLFLAGATVGTVSGFSPALALYYPYHHGLLHLVEEGAAGYFVGHLGLYLSTYYLPWELSFRGVMVIAVTEPLREKTGGLPPIALAVAMLQTAPSTILHFGHPTAEIFGALAFGVISGYLALKSRSIVPSLVFHAAAGLTLDSVVVIRGVAG